MNNQNFKQSLLSYKPNIKIVNERDFIEKTIGIDTYLAKKVGDPRKYPKFNISIEYTYTPSILQLPDVKIDSNVFGFISNEEIYKSTPKFVDLELTMLIDFINLLKINKQVKISHLRFIFENEEIDTDYIYYHISENYCYTIKNSYIVQTKQHNIELLITPFTSKQDNNFQELLDMSQIIIYYIYQKSKGRNININLFQRGIYNNNYISYTIENEYNTKILQIINYYSNVNPLKIVDKICRKRYDFLNNALRLAVLKNYYPINVPYAFKNGASFIFCHLLSTVVNHPHGHPNCLSFSEYDCNNLYSLFTNLFNDYTNKKITRIINSEIIPIDFRLFNLIFNQIYIKKNEMRYIYGKDSYAYQPLSNQYLRDSYFYFIQKCYRDIDNISLLPKNDFMSPYEKKENGFFDHKMLLFRNFLLSNFVLSKLPQPQHFPRKFHLIENRMQGFRYDILLSKLNLVVIFDYILMDFIFVGKDNINKILVYNKNLGFSEYMDYFLYILKICFSVPDVDNVKFYNKFDEYRKNFAEGNDTDDYFNFLNLTLDTMKKDDFYIYNQFYSTNIRINYKITKTFNDVFNKEYTFVKLENGKLEKKYGNIDFLNYLKDGKSFIENMKTGDSFYIKVTNFIIIANQLVLCYYFFRGTMKDQKNLLGKFYFIYEEMDTNTIKPIIEKEKIISAAGWNLFKDLCLNLQFFKELDHYVLENEYTEKNKLELSNNADDKYYKSLQIIFDEDLLHTFLGDDLVLEPFEIIETNLLKDFNEEKRETKYNPMTTIYNQINFSNVNSYIPFHYINDYIFPTLSDREGRIYNLQKNLNDERFKMVIPVANESNYLKSNSSSKLFHRVHEFCRYNSFTNKICWEYLLFDKTEKRSIVVGDMNHLRSKNVHNFENMLYYIITWDFIGDNYYFLELFTKKSNEISGFVYLHNDLTPNTVNSIIDYLKKKILDIFSENSGIPIKLYKIPVKWFGHNAYFKKFISPFNFIKEEGNMISRVILSFGQDILFDQVSDGLTQENQKKFLCTYLNLLQFIEDIKNKIPVTAILDYYYKMDELFLRKTNLKENSLTFTNKIDEVTSIALIDDILSIFWTNYNQPPNIAHKFYFMNLQFFCCNSINITNDSFINLAFVNDTSYIFFVPYVFYNNRLNSDELKFLVVEFNQLEKKTIIYYTQNSSDSFEMNLGNIQKFKDHIVKPFIDNMFKISYDMKKIEACCFYVTNVEKAFHGPLSNLYKNIFEFITMVIHIYSINPVETNIFEAYLIKIFDNIENKELLKKYIKEILFRTNVS